MGRQYLDEMPNRQYLDEMPNRNYLDEMPNRQYLDENINAQQVVESQEQTPELYNVKNITGDYRNISNTLSNVAKGIKRIPSSISNFLSKREPLPSIEEQKEMATIRQLYREGNTKEADLLNKAYEKKYNVGVIDPKERNKIIGEVAGEAIMESPKTAIELVAEVATGFSGIKPIEEYAHKKGYTGKVANKQAKSAGIYLRVAALDALGSLAGSAASKYVSSTPHLAGAPEVAGSMARRATFWGGESGRKEAASYLNKEKELTAKNLAKSGVSLGAETAIGGALGFIFMIPQGIIRVPLAGAARYGIESTREALSDTPKEKSNKVLYTGIQMLLSAFGGVTPGQRQAWQADKPEAIAFDKSGSIAIDIASPEGKEIVALTSEYLPKEFVNMPNPAKVEMLNNIASGLEKGLDISESIDYSLDPNVYDKTITPSEKLPAGTETKIPATAEELDPSKRKLPKATEEPENYLKAKEEEAIKEKIFAKEKEDEIKKLNILKADVEAGEPGKRIPVEFHEDGSIKKYGGYPSTYPEWFKGNDWNKKAVLRVIDKAIAGDPIESYGKNQKIILDHIKKQVEELPTQTGEIVEEVQTVDLKPGDKVKVRDDSIGVNEWMDVKKGSKGEIKLVDGETYILDDTFDNIPVEGGMEGIKRKEFVDRTEEFDPSIREKIKETTPIKHGGIDNTLTGQERLDPRLKDLALGKMSRPKHVYEDLGLEENEKLDPNLKDQALKKIKYPSIVRNKKIATFSGVEPKESIAGRELTPKEISELKRNLLETKNFLKNTLNPLGQATTEQKDILFENIGEKRKAIDDFYYKGEKLHKYIEGRGDIRNLEFAHKYETGQYNLMTEEEKALASHYSKFGEDMYNAISKYKNINKLQNYLSHMYDTVYGEGHGMKPSLEGFKEFLKGRKYSEIFKAQEAGLKPVLNMEEAARRKFESVQKFVAAQELKNKYTSTNDMIFIKSGTRPPSGFAPINDKIAKIYYPVETKSGGKVIAKAGEWYAKEGLARVINNHLSPSTIGNNVIARGYRGINNQMTMFKLGLSQFHATATTINAGGSQFGKAAQDVVRGKPLSAIKNALMSPVAGPAKAIKGWLITRNYHKGDPEAEKIVAELYKGGGSLGIPRKFEDHIEKFRKAISNKKVGNAIINSVPATLELSVKPLMKYYIPWIKVASFDDSYSRLLSHYAEDIEAGKITTGELARQAVNQQDRLFGKMAIDNLFWDKNLEAILDMSVMSQSWTLGTIQQMGGGTLDTLKVPFERKFTDSMADLFGVLTFGALVGSVYHYAHTGEAPKTMKDRFFPQTGEFDENGNPIRVSIPGYSNEVISFALHPLRTLGHKTAPLANYITQSLQNEDFYSDPIRGEENPLWDQVKYTIQFWEPLSVIQTKRSIEQGEKPLRIAEAQFGFREANREWRITPLEDEIFSEYSKQTGIKIKRSPEKKEEGRQKAKARIEYKKGNEYPIIDLVSKGKIKNVRQFKKEASLTSAQRIFKRLSPDRQIALMRKMDLKEMKAYFPVASKKAKYFMSTPAN